MGISLPLMYWIAALAFMVAGCDVFQPSEPLDVDAGCVRRQHTPTLRTLLLAAASTANVAGDLVLVLPDTVGFTSASLFRKEIGGQELHRVTQPLGRLMREPRWNPQGERIVYEEFVGFDNSHLVMVDRAGSLRKVLTPEEGYLVRGHRWSPAGDRLLLQFLNSPAIVDTSGRLTPLVVRDDVFEGDSIYFHGGTAQWDATGANVFVWGSIGVPLPDGFDNPEQEIFKVSLETGRIVDRVTRNALREGTGFEISPDGSSILLRQPKQIVALNTRDNTIYPVPGTEKGCCARWTNVPGYFTYLDHSITQYTPYLGRAFDPSPPRPLLDSGNDAYDVWLDNASTTAIEDHCEPR